MDDGCHGVYHGRWHVASSMDDTMNESPDDYMAS